MAASFRRSLEGVLACMGVALLVACSGAEDPRKPPASGIRSVPIVGPLVAVFSPAPSDDEFAVDAREVTRRTATRDTTDAPALKLASLPPAGQGAVSPPKLNVLYVTNGRLRAFGPNIWVRGTVEDDTDGIEVTINGQPAVVKEKSFQRRIPVPPGETELTVRAEDADGNSVSQTFVLVRTALGQSLPAARPPADIAAPEYRLVEPPAADRVPRIDDVQEAGVYMILMAGTPSAHFVKMPSLAQCREAVEYTENAACMFHTGRN